MFGLISMPVRLFPAARSKVIPFHMVHRPDHVRIKTPLYCPKDQRIVERSEIVKGFAAVQLVDTASRAHL